MKILKIIRLVKDLKCAIDDQMNFCIATTFSKEYTVYTHSTCSFSFFRVLFLTLPSMMLAWVRMSGETPSIDPLPINK
jgi:hypothetical protein